MTSGDDAGGSLSSPHGFGAGSVPVPDPTRLTTDAVNAATDQWRRDLLALREILEARLTASDEAIILQSNRLDRVHLQESDALAAQETLHAERTEAVYVRIGSEVNALLERITGLHKLEDERVNNIDKSFEFIRAEVESLRVHSTDRFTESSVLLEKFASIGLQFKERDVRTEQASKSSADALAAALQAAKELVNAQGEASAAAAVKSETSFTKQIDQIGTIISTLEKALDARITELKERIDRGEGSTRGVADQRIDTRQNTTLLVSVIAVFLTVIIVGLSIFAATHK